MGSSIIVQDAYLHSDFSVCHMLTTAFPMSVVCNPYTDALWQSALLISASVLSLFRPVLSAPVSSSNTNAKAIIEEAHQITVFLVLRDHLSVLPQKNMILKLNDIIVIRTQEEES